MNSGIGSYRCPLERRPQDPSGTGEGLRFVTLDHGGEYPDNMPQAIKLIISAIC
jgi:hypothetical protein